MAGISLSLEGDKIQLSFQKDDQATAIVMDAGAARTLASALTQLLDVMDDGVDLEDALEEGISDEEIAEELARQLAEEGDDADTIEGEVVDVTSPTIDIGVDQDGHAVVALRAGDMPPIMLRLQDEEARHISQSLSEILGAPRDIRLSQGGH